MVDFNDAITLLLETGFTNVIAPFILIFAVVFAILQKSKIFHGGANEDNSAKKINATIAFVFGIFAVISVNVVNFIAQSLATAAMAIVVILCVLVILGLLLGDNYVSIFQNDKIKYSIAGIVLLLTIIFLFTIFNVWEWISTNLGSITSGNGEWFGLLFIFAIVIGALYWITKSDEK
jgi:UDP-N-acetylmuramyl pentapeptide phosphotransferase/UDP-N-acetylglucosamine-1-phosphate transferase